MAGDGKLYQDGKVWATGRIGIFGNDKLLAIAGKYERSVAQIVLPWVIQRGVVAISKAAQKERMLLVPRILFLCNLKVFSVYLRAITECFYDIIRSPFINGKRNDSTNV